VRGEERGERGNITLKRNEKIKSTFFHVVFHTQKIGPERVNKYSPYYNSPQILPHFIIILIYSTLHDFSSKQRTVKLSNKTTHMQHYIKSYSEMQLSLMK
jgi:hypothetical protein